MPYINIFSARRELDRYRFCPSFEKFQGYLGFHTAFFIH